MTTLKGWITTTCLVAMLMVSTMTVNAGIIIAGATESTPPPCTEKSGKEKIDYSIIIAGITGIIIAGFTGIIIAGATAEPVEECGIIIAG